MAEFWEGWQFLQFLRRWRAKRSARRRGTDRFDDFNEDIRSALVNAMLEAERRGARAIEPEHLLVGLLRDNRGVVAWIFDGLGLDIGLARVAAEAAAGPAVSRPAVEFVGLSSRSKQLIELTVREADRLGDSFIGPEHMLLGVARFGGTAASVLTSLGADGERLRRRIARAQLAGNAAE